MAVLCCAVASRAEAQIDVLFSISDTDMNAGTSLDLALGETGSMYLWVVNNDAAAIDGLGLDIFSDAPSVLEAVSHTIEEPAGRWAATSPGDLGDLVTNTNAFALIGFGSNGIANDGVGTLHSEIMFDATANGIAGLSLAENSNLISVSGNAPNSVNFGSGRVSVSAIPEPGSMIVISMLGIVAATRRRRNRA